METPDDIWHTSAVHIGRRVLVYETVTSTNDLAAGLAQDEAAAGTVIIGKHQTAGRGQHGRVWQSRPGDSLLFSTLLFPPPQLRRPVLLTAWAAVSAASAIRLLTNADVQIKWPNDLLISGKKVAGILIEQSSIAGRLATIVGLGVNLAQTADDFAEADLPSATSLAAATGVTVDLRTMALEVIRELDTCFEMLLAGNFQPLEEEWRYRLGLECTRATLVLTNGASILGEIQGITFNAVFIQKGGSQMKVLPELIRNILPE